MGGAVLKLPRFDVEIPRPRLWDFVALGLAVASLVLAGVNLQMALARGAGGAISGPATTVFFLLQLGLSLGSLLVLGKTAKEGTIWGNLIAVGGMLAGMSGVLLAAALFVTA